MSIGSKLLQGKRFVREIVTHISSPFLSIPKSRFIILTPGRCGSTLLARLLSQNPEVFCYNKILRFKRLFPAKYSLRKTLTWSENISSVGFKLKHYQIQHQKRLNDEKKFMNIMKNNEFRFVYLYRNSVIRQSISYHVAKKRNKFQKKSDEELPSVRINPRKVIDTAKTFENGKKIYKDLLHGTEYIEIEYEKDLMDQNKHQKTCNNIFDFLGVNICNVEATTKKTTPNPKKSILNFNDVKECAENNGYYLE